MIIILWYVGECPCSQDMHGEILSIMCHYVSKLLSSGSVKEREKKCTMH